jgi:tetratricopeptide (TPR) repeat protein
MTKKTVFILIMFFCALEIARSQDQRVIDSLMTVLHSRVGGDRFGPLYELTFEYIGVNNEEALRKIEGARKAALLSGDSLWIVKGNRVRGQILYLMERIEEARSVFDATMPIAERNGYDREMFYMVFGLGRSYLLQGKYDMALLDLFKAEYLAGKLMRPEIVAEATHVIGMVYYKLKDYRKALEYYFRATNAYDNMRNVPPHMQSNIALCYIYLRDISAAGHYVTEALNKCATGCSKPIMINIEYALGLLALRVGDLESAEEHLLKSLHLAHGHRDTRFQLDNIYLLAEIYMAQQRFREVEMFLADAEMIY